MKIDTVILGILKYLYETSDEAMPSLLPIKPDKCTGDGSLC